MKKTYQRMKRTIVLLVSVMMVNIMTVIAQTSIVTYQSDGTQTIAKVTSEFYDAPDNVLAVDIRGTGIMVATSIEPNCLFIIGEGDEAPIGVGNTIVKSGSSYTATNIELTDGSDFYSPVDFTASNIEFTYYNDRWSDGTNGWNTIMLPYDVSFVKADDEIIDWFRDNSETDKQFWVKQFVSDEAGVVNFDFADEMKANTPYLIALPNDLSGKTIKFIGQRVTVHKNGNISSVTGSNYCFVGTTMTTDKEDIYRLNADGSEFVLDDGSTPFRAYFKAIMSDQSESSLSIGEDVATALSEELRVKSEKFADAWYDLQGRRIEHPTKGMYIQNGRLFIKK